ncbi:MAG: response regulator transcription factor [Clostridia bacterium]
METILLVEDNDSIIKGLEYTLKQEGFEVVIAKSFKEAMERIKEKTYTLILLDISLPDGDGFEICKRVKERQDTPVIFLTARDEESNVVLGLDMGADDYVTKPFRVRELISRIHTVLRRYHKESEKQNIIQIQDVTVDVNKMAVYKAGEEVILTALEYRILLMLFHHMGQTITREQILEKIWDLAGNFVNDNTLTVYIKRIREKLEDDPTNPQIIKTVRGIGYKVGE